MTKSDLEVDRALEVATEAGRLAGLEVEGATVVRVRSSVQVELPNADVIARVEVAERKSYAARQVVVAELWAARGAPVPILVQPQLQPFVFEDAAVTLWQRLIGGPTTNSTELGRTVRALHDSTREADLSRAPRLKPFADIEGCIESPPGWLADEERAEIAEQYRHLRSWWDAEASGDPFGVGLAHGDVHRNNTVETHDRGVILVDLEDAGVGPLSWDFVPLAVGVRRHGDPPEEFKRFVAGYGLDPRRWSGFERMCSLYELWVTGWTIRCSEIAPHIAREARIRLAGILGRSREAWTML